MANRKRPIVLRCPVTAEERKLIEQKMAQIPTKRIGANVLIGLFEKPCHTNGFLDFRATNFLVFHFTKHT